MSGFRKDSAWGPPEHTAAGLNPNHGNKLPLVLIFADFSFMNCIPSW